MSGKYVFNSADDRQKELLDAELAVAPRSKAANIATILVLLVLIFGVAIAFFAVEDRDFSETENRALQTFPEFSWESLANGDFTYDVSKYLADQFPGREFFIELKAAVEIGLGKRQNNGVILGDGGYLVPRMDNANLENLKKNVNAMATFSAAAEKAGVPVDAFFAGRLADVADSVLGFNYSEAEPGDAWRELQVLAAEYGFEYNDLRAPLADRLAAGEYVYYRTDHHWTTLGAYYAYCEIMADMGVEPESYSHFTEEIAADDFYGTTWSSSGIRWAKPDTITYLHFPGDETEFTLTFEATGEVRTGLYDRSYLEGKDKYSSFISENCGRVDIKKNTDEERETLLVIKDSFAMSVLPMLAEKYDLVVIDLRYYLKPTYRLLESEGIDRVLILYNMDSLTTASSAAILAAGVK